MEGSQGCLSWLPRAIASLLVVVFILTAPIALLARAASQVVFSPQVMAKMVGNRLLETDVARRALAEALMREMLAQAPDGSGETMGALLLGVERSDMERITEIVLPPEWGKEQVVGNLQALYAWIDDDRAFPQIKLDLEPVRSRILGTGAEDLVEVLVDAWPSCTPEQVARMGLAAVQGGSIETCEPPEPIRTGLAGVLADGVRLMANGMPDAVDLGPQVVSGGEEAQIGPFKERVRMVRFLTLWGWLFPAGLLGLIVALVVRSIAGLFRWWGIPLTASGLAALAMVAPSSGLARAFGRTLTSQLQGAPLLAELVGNLGSGLIQSIATRAAVGALFLTAAGAGLLIVGRISTRRAHKARPAESAGGRQQIVGISEEAVSPGPSDERPTGVFG